MANALVVSENESFVFADRCSDGTTKLCAPKGRDRRTVEVVARVKNLVAVKEIAASMYLIGSRLGDHVDYRARVPPLVGAVEIGLNLELPDGFHAWAQDDGKRQTIVVVDAIVEEIIRPFAVAI